MWQGRADYPCYQHHKAQNPFQYGVYWVRSWSRKLRRRGADRRYQQRLFSSGQAYFFVPLQHDGDAQITQHSPFAENTDFIIKVLRSFAEFAPRDSLLVFRQHPHARGGPGHSELIYSLAKELRVQSRVVHMVEGDTPDLAENSAGVVLINSTVGLQALERGAPLMALGESLYRRPSLTFSGELNDFWTKATAPEPDVATEFLARAKNLTQAPVSLYATRDESLCWGFAVQRK
jgi:capsular polysaccharide export protein